MVSSWVCSWHMQGAGLISAFAEWMNKESIWKQCSNQCALQEISSEGVDVYGCSCKNLCELKRHERGKWWRARPQRPDCPTSRLSWFLCAVSLPVKRRPHYLLCSIVKKIKWVRICEGPRTHCEPQEVFIIITVIIYSPHRVSWNIISKALLHNF